MYISPFVNLAISSRASATGVDHLGIQVDSADELGELATRVKEAGETTVDHEATTCCYAESDKPWAKDPAGVRWKTFFTRGDSTAYCEDVIPDNTGATACCAPAAATKQACC